MRRVLAQCRDNPRESGYTALGTVDARGERGCWQLLAGGLPATRAASSLARRAVQGLLLVRFRLITLGPAHVIAGP